MNEENRQVQYIEEDTIDLRELWATLMKRKLVIGLATGMITTLAIIYVLVKTPTFEVKSNVMVGFIGEQTAQKTNNIANPNVISKRLNIVFNVEDKIATEEDFISEVSSITVNKKLENFIIIKTEGISNKEALKKNKEVVSYLQALYEPKIKQYKTNIKNSIKNTKQAIRNIDEFEIKNVKEQIRLLKTQKIAKIDEKIKFYKSVKLVSLDKKIKFHSHKLKEYISGVNKLYKSSIKTKNAAAQTISSIQMLNYQTLILSSQNRIEDLKVEKSLIINEKIVNLQREKKNINSETIRKLEHQINVDLVTKRRNLEEKVQRLQYNMSEQFAQNSRVIGEYVIKDYPFKPKKKLIVVVAFITGLMLSIFLVFFLEFIQGSRKEESLT